MSLHLSRFIQIMLLSLAVVANTATASDSIEQLMELSGMNHDLESIPEQITTSVKQSGSAGQDAQTASVNTIMVESFDPVVMKSIVKAHLKQELSSADIKAALKWLHSPLGKKITALENAASDVQDLADIQKKMPELLENNDRFALIRKLDDAIKVSESTVNTLVIMQGAMLRGMMASAPADKRWNDDRIKEYLAGIEPQIKAEYELLTIASLAYTYRNLPDNEVRAYIDFANTPAGQHYHSSAIAAMNEALTAASEKMGQRLGQLTPSPDETKDNKNEKML